jgi:broad specificity phosphatase PhoE
MTTTVVLIRHAAHDLLGRALAGRMRGVSLNAAGQEQARRLPERLARWPIAALYAGPLQRAQETGSPLALHLGLYLETSRAFDELDAGRWTGLEFSALGGEDDWARWNSQRGLASCPAGESFIEVQARVARGLRTLAEGHPDQTVAVVSHGDTIKAAIMVCLGLAPEFHSRLEIGPASLSVLATGDWGSKLLKMNEEEA